MAKKKPQKPASRQAGKATRRLKGGASTRRYKKAAASRRAKLLPKRPRRDLKRAPKGLALKQKGVALKISAKQSKKQEDQNKKAEGLMARGRERGFVTYDEILKQFPNIETDVLFLEELYEKFSTARIDVLEGGGLLEVETEPEKGYSRSDSQY